MIIEFGKIEDGKHIFNSIHFWTDDDWIMFQHQASRSPNENEYQINHWGNITNYYRKITENEAIKLIKENNNDIS